MLFVFVTCVVGSACDQQSFGKCHHYCRESTEHGFGYECYCESGYVLQPNNLNCFVLGEKCL